MLTSPPSRTPSSTRVRPSAASTSAGGSYCTSRPIDGERFALSLESLGGVQLVRGAGDPMELIGHWRPGEPLFAVRIDDEPLTVGVERKSGAWRLTAHGASHRVEVLPPHVA